VDPAAAEKPVISEVLRWTMEFTQVFSALILNKTKTNSIQPSLIQWLDSSWSTKVAD
jgi:hypothetical protein